MSLGKLLDTKLTHINLLPSDTLTAKGKKMKLRKQSHSPQQEVEQNSWE